VLINLKRLKKSVSGSKNRLDPATASLEFGSRKTRIEPALFRRSGILEIARHPGFSRAYYIIGGKKISKNVWKFRK
jgi:hypothetical protein